MLRMANLSVLLPIACCYNQRISFEWCEKEKSGGDDEATKTLCDFCTCISNRKKSEEQVKEVFICPESNISFFFLHALLFFCRSALFVVCFHARAESVSASARQRHRHRCWWRPPIFSINYVCVYLFHFAVIFIIKIGQFMKIGLCTHSNIHENKSVVFCFFFHFFFVAVVCSRAVLFISAAAEISYSYLFSFAFYRFCSCSNSLLCVCVYMCAWMREFSFCFSRLFFSGALFYSKCYLFNFAYAWNYSPNARTFFLCECVCDCLIFNCKRT